MNVGDIITRVRRQFGDNFGSRITEADVLRWINDGMREVIQKNELLQVKATINFVAGQAEYAFPGSMMKLQTLTHNGRPLRYLGFREFFDFTKDAASNVTGVPTTYTVWAGNFWFYPSPKSVGTFQTFYLKYPTEVTDSGDTPEIPETYHMRLVEYCLAQAAEFDEDSERYASKMGEFVNNVASQKDDHDVVERDQYPVISVKPEEYGDPLWNNYGEHL